MEEQNERDGQNSPPASSSSSSHSGISPYPFTPVIPRNAQGVSANEKDFSDLWKKPLLIPGTSKSSSPLKEQRINRRIRNHLTPSRKQNASLPTKLFGESESDESPVNSLTRSRSAYRRSLSQPEPEHGSGSYGPTLNPKRLKLFVEEGSPFEEFSACQPKSEAAIGGTSSSSTTLTPAVKKLFVKSQSDSQLLSSTTCNITTALEKIEKNPNLIGDGSLDYYLTVMEHGKHPDLKEITGDTLATLLEKKEDNLVTFKIIDCRYPYEYNGGHIRGALNCYTQKQVREELLDPKTALNPTPGKSGPTAPRDMLIFHCEFSSKRGPALCRYLRTEDRISNEQAYPTLFYPELYVLHGGYKEFFEKFPHLCDPQQYVPMEHPEHTCELKRFKSICKLTKAKSKKF